MIPTSKKTRRKTLTGNQLTWLARITVAGEPFDRILNLRGRAKDWANRYRAALRAAIVAVNSGLAVNAPLKPGWGIAVYSRGRAESCKLVVVDPLVAVAVDAVALAQDTQVAP